MWTTLIPAIITAANAALKWLPEVTTALHLGAATINFGIAIHRAVRYTRCNPER
jgi:hypothetical protein